MVQHTLPSRRNLKHQWLTIYSYKGLPLEPRRKRFSGYSTLCIILKLTASLNALMDQLSVLQKTHDSGLFTVV